MHVRDFFCSGSWIFVKITCLILQCLMYPLDYYAICCWSLLPQFLINWSISPTAYKKLTIDLFFFFLVCQKMMLWNCCGCLFLFIILVCCFCSFVSFVSWCLIFICSYRFSFAEDWGDPLRLKFWFALPESFGSNPDSRNNNTVHDFSALGFSLYKVWCSFDIS